MKKTTVKLSFSAHDTVVGVHITGLPHIWHCIAGASTEVQDMFSLPGHVSPGLLLGKTRAEMVKLERGE